MRTVTRYRPQEQESACSFGPAYCTSYPGPRFCVGVVEVLANRDVIYQHPCKIVQYKLRAMSEIRVLNLIYTHVVPR